MDSESEYTVGEDASAYTAGEGEGPSTGLLSFYDRLRERISSYVDRHSGRLGSKTADALLLVPDLFMFLLRLTLDKDIPKSTRTLIGGALAYFVLPADLLPEIVVGPTGYLDDLILGIVVLAHAFGDDLEPYAEKYWSGSRSLRIVLKDLLSTTDALLSTDVYSGLRSFLARRGIDLDDVTSQAREDSDEPDDDPANFYSADTDTFAADASYTS